MKRFKTLLFIALICIPMFSSITTFTNAESRKTASSDSAYSDNSPTSDTSSPSNQKPNPFSNAQLLSVPNTKNLATSNLTQNGWGLDNPQNLSNFAYIDKDTMQVIIGVDNRHAGNYAEIQNLIAKHQGKTVNVVSTLGKAIAVVADIPIKALTVLNQETQNAGLARYIEPNMKVQAQFEPNDLYWSQQWGPQKIKADWAWNTTTGSSNVTVAVVDTGVDYNHPDLRQNYWFLPTGQPAGYDWVNNDTDPMDDHGHGTHVAGIIAAQLNNSIGIAGLAQVRIMAEKVLNSQGYGQEDWVAEGIIDATNKGAKIISMSLGGYSPSNLIQDAVEYAYNAGVLIVAAAGNDNTNTKLYPAGYSDEVVAVAATDQNDNKASFSNWGNWIELAAPGVDIISTVPWGYESMSGTSMATPHVSGLAALVWSEFPNKSRDWVRLWLRYTADDLGTPGFDDYYGYGRIDAQKAVQTPAPNIELLVSEFEKPSYVEPNRIGVFNATVLNFGNQEQNNVTVQLLINSTIVDNATINSLPSGATTIVSLKWNATAEGLCNATAYIVPKPGEINLSNNAVSAYVYVGFPVKVYVLRSYGTAIDTTPWETLNDNWQVYGNKMVYIDYTTLNKDNITYSDIKATNADVLVISCAYAWQYTDSEINAISRYVFEGHGLIATAGTFYYGVPNNNKLAPLFGMNETTTWTETGTDLLEIDPAQASNPLFAKIPNPMVFPSVGTATPPDLVWDSDELVGGTYAARGHFQESAIVVYRGLVYISPWLEVIPSYYRFPLQLLYNAMTWSQYQKPQHELSVSLEAPSHLKPSQPTTINASALNLGLNTETNVTLYLMINGVEVDNSTITILPAGSSINISYAWKPQTEGRYNITAYAPPVPSEENTANNKNTQFVAVTQVAIGIIETHGETLLTNDLMNYYTNLGYAVDEITTPLTSQLLSSYQILIVGENYFNTLWSTSEITALRQYLASEGGFIAIGGDVGTSVQQILQWYGIRYTWVSAQLGPTSNFDRQHPIMQGVNTIYAGNPVNSFYVTPTVSYYIANDSSNTHILIAGSEAQGHVLAMSDDFAAYLYQYDNQIMFRNTVKWMTTRYVHDLAVTLQTPAFQMPSYSSLLNATVQNKGLQNETSVELYLLIDGKTVNSTLIPPLIKGESDTVIYLWTPVKVGLYNVTAYAPPVSGENYTRNNAATALVTVTYPIINPVEGQWANYTLQLDINGTPTVENMNITYQHYITPYLINATMQVQLQKPVVGLPQTYWMTINVMNRMVEEDNGIGWAGLWYPGWIETNIKMKSTVNLLYGIATVVNSKIIKVNGRPVDCWELSFENSSTGYMGYTLWYDKVTGLWIAMEITLTPLYSETVTLVDTNVPIGSFKHELSVSLEAPNFLAPCDSTIINATVFNLGLSVETNVTLQILINETLKRQEVITELKNGSSHTISYPWAPAQKASFNVTAYATPVPGENVTSDNTQTVFVIVRPPLIQPKPGDFANYTIVTKSGSIEYSSTLKYTYLQYISAHVIKIHVDVGIGSNSSVGYDITVNALTRLIETGPTSQDGPYYDKWIETDIKVGSTINILNGNGTVIGETDLTINSRNFHTWVVLTSIQNTNIISYYDKSTGLLIKSVSKNPQFSYETTLTLLETNVDVTPPTISITSPTSHLHHTFASTPNITVTWTAEDNETGIDHYALYLNGTLVANNLTATSYHLSKLREGSYNVTVAAFDTRENQASDYVNITVDLTPPSVKITSPTSGSVTNKTSIPVSWTQSDNQTGISSTEIYANGKLIQAAPGIPYNLTDFTEGTYNITVKVYDMAGNSQSDTITIKIDRTPPTLSIESLTSGSLLKESIQINASSQDTNFKVMLLFIDKNQVSYTTSQSIAYTWDTKQTSDGTHTITLIAFDKAGNTSEETTTITVDNTKPTLAISNPLNGTMITGRVTINFTASDTNLLKKTLYIDDAPVDTNSQTSYTWDTTKTIDGTHTITLIAFDKAGNTSEEQITVTTINQQNTTKYNLMISLSIGTLLGLVIGGIIFFLFNKKKLISK